MQQNSELTLFKYCVAKLTAKLHTKACSTENLQAAFRKTGKFPFDKNTISVVNIAPAVLYM